MLACILTVVALAACHDLTDPIRQLFAPPASRYLNGPGTTVVTPSNMHGWSFWNYNNTSACTTCLMVSGPTGQPLGNGSAEIVPSVNEGAYLELSDYMGVQFAHVTALGFAFYVKTHGATASAGQLRFDADYDLSDTDTSSFALTFAPPADTSIHTWRRFDARGTGAYWFGPASVKKAGATATNVCVATSPCTWSRLLEKFPNIGVHNTRGRVYLGNVGTQQAGSHVDVDSLVFGVDSANTVFDFEASSPVPTTPPDSIPTALFAQLGTVSGAPLSDSTYRKDIIIVEFVATATTPQRAAALDSVAGTVVGGHRFPEDTVNGRYFVRISGGTTAALMNAVSILRRLSAVSYAGWWPLYDPAVPAYKKPTDGTGWTTWLIDPSLPVSVATRPNWALEFTRAPMAWGCSTGSQGTKVAVIDRQLFKVSNIAANVDTSLSSLRPDRDTSAQPTFFTDHGVRVASALAAVGNDSSGMTGMAWRARLMLIDKESSYKVRNDTDATRLDWDTILEEHIVNAGIAGASVINLSFQTRGVHDTASARKTVTSAISRLAKLSPARAPLIVIAAGNEGQSAATNGYASAKTTYPNQILVVGALTVDGNAWSHSNSGSLVDVYAPGVAVGVSNKWNVIVRDSGTSFAAPLVSGVAVLLKDFDPAATASQIVNDITTGATVAGGIRRLDAYGALKAVASHTGSPLCGTPVYSSSAGGVYAVRDSNPAHDELLFTSQFSSGNANTDLLNALHGGKSIQIQDYLQYQWNASTRTWASATFTGNGANYHQGAGGAFLSWYDGSDHDRRTYVITNPTAVNFGSGIDSNEVQPILYALDSTGINKPLAFKRFNRPTSVVRICSFTLDSNGQCDPLHPDSLTSGSWTGIGAPSGAPPSYAFAPQGNFVLFAANRRFTETLYGSPASCTMYGQQAHCLQLTSYRDSSAGFALWKVDTAGTNMSLSSWSAVPVSVGTYFRNDLNVVWVQVDETGTVMAMELAKDVRLSATSWTGCQQRTIEYRALPGHRTLTAGTLIRSISLPDRTDCGSFGPGTISPLKNTRSLPIVLPTRSTTLPAQYRP